MAAERRSEARWQSRVDVGRKREVQYVAEEWRVVTESSRAGGKETRPCGLITEEMCGGVGSEDVGSQKDVLL